MRIVDLTFELISVWIYLESELKKENVLVSFIKILFYTWRSI